MDWHEFDGPLHCRSCGEFLHNSLTIDGFGTLREMYKKGMREPSRWSEYMECYYFMDWYMIHTFVGPMDPLGRFKDFDV